MKLITALEIGVFVLALGFGVATTNLLKQPAFTYQCAREKYKGVPYRSKSGKLYYRLLAQIEFDKKEVSWNGRTHCPYYIIVDTVPK